MAKLKDFLRVTAEKLNIPELDALAGSSQLQEIEIDDEAASKATSGLQSLISPDDATEIPEIVSKVKDKLFPVHKKSVLSEFEKVQDDYVRKMFGEGKLSELKKADTAFERQKLIDQWNMDNVKTLKETQSQGDEELKNRYSALTDKYNNINSEYESFKSQAQQKEEEINKAWEQKILRSEIQRQASSYNWRDDLDDRLKRLAVNDIVDEVSRKAILKPTETGEIAMFDKDNPELAYHEGSKKMSFKEFFEQQASPYLKKSDGNQEGQQPNQQGQRPPAGGQRQQQTQSAYRSYTKPATKQGGGSMHDERWSKAG